MVEKYIIYSTNISDRYGGMMSHMNRLRSGIEPFGVKVWFINELTLPELFRILRAKNKVVYVVNSRNLLRNFFSLLRLVGFKVVIRIGGMSVGDSSMQQSVRTFLWRVLSNRIILVNESLYRDYLASVFHKIYFIPGFIRPALSEVPKIKYDVSFVYAKTDTDIYNREAILSIISAHPKLKFLVQCYDIELENSLDDLSMFLVNNGISLNTRISLLGPNDEALTNVLSAKLYVRPTREDGDSNLIREVLSFQGRVLASDVVKRPESVIEAPISEFVSLIPKILSPNYMFKNVDNSDYFESHFNLLMPLLND